ncbi:MAG: DNA repair protein RecO [Desulfovibrionaceae bacterium]
MDFTEKGIVLKVGRFREIDAWVRFLTPGRGVLQAMAFGGMKSRKRFSGCLDPLNLVLFTVGSSRGGAYLDLREGALLHAFADIKRDNARLGPASACLKFVEAVVREADGSRGVFELLLETLHLIESMSSGFQDIPVMFRAKLAFEQGYRPDFLHCGGCGAEQGTFDNPRFFVEKGQVLCPRCIAGEDASGPGLPLGWGALKTLDFILANPPAMWTRLGVDPAVRDQAYRAVDRFLAYHLGVTMENGRFRQQ